MNVTISPFMIVSAIGIGLISAFIAHKRGRNPYSWFAIGFLFGILGIFAIFFAGAKKKTEPPAKSEPVLTIQGPKDKFWYYLDPENKQQGPMSFDGMTTAWKQGKVDLSTYVWHEEMTDWKQLKETVGAE